MTPPPRVPGEEGSEEQLVGFVARTFAPPTRGDGRQDLDWIAQISVSLQRQVGALPIAEAIGVVHGAPKNVVAELLGRVGSVGEQLGLSFTALSDAYAWLGVEPSPISTQAARAMTEMSIAWSMAASHGFANLVARTLLLNAASRAELVERFPKAHGFAPYSTIRDASLSLNSESVRKLRRCASASGSAEACASVELLANLVADPVWQSLQEHRASDFHRWRRHTFGPSNQDSPWREGSADISMLVASERPFEQPDPRPGYRDAEAGLRAVATSLSAWGESLPALTASLGVAIWAEEGDLPPGGREPHRD